MLPALALLVFLLSPTVHASSLPFPAALHLQELPTVRQRASPTCEGKTFDSCYTAEDCEDSRICLGRLDGNIVFCDSFVDEDGKHDIGCVCAPPGQFLRCDKGGSKACEAGEVCGLNPTSGSELCMSCCAVSPDSNLNYTLADPADARCQTSPSPTPSPSPSPVIQPAGALTPCTASPAYPCARDRECRSDLGQPCGLFDIYCECTPTDPDETCGTQSDCPDGEVCVSAPAAVPKQCAACAIARAHAGLLVDEGALESRCNDVADDTRPQLVANFPPAPNGLNYDACRASHQCQGNRTCAPWNDFEEVFESGECGLEGGKDAWVNCRCKPSDNNTKECLSSLDCPAGEECTLVSSECVSVVAKEAAFDEATVRGENNKTLPKPATGAGFSGASCTLNSECVAPRRCTHMFDEEPAWGRCAGRKRNCECTFPFPQACTRSKDCDRGEKCLREAGSLARPFCHSQRSEDRGDLLRLSQETPKPTNPFSNGFAYDACKNARGCADGYLCVHASERSDDGDECDGSRAGCVCKRSGDPNSGACNLTADCDDGEMCVEFWGAVPVRRECRSRRWLRNNRDVARMAPEELVGAPSDELEPDMSIAPTPEESGEEDGDVDAMATSPPASPSTSGFALQTPGATASASESPDSSSANLEESPEEEVCVDARALAHLPSHALVFGAAHRRSAVLCDAAGACATPGHLVVFKGEAMLMRRYCALAASGGCSRRVMLVNSPRMRRGLRVASKTGGLEFTALAARFGSAAEEVALRVLVRAGM